LAATLVVIGELLSIIAGIFHPAREDPNNHPAVFAEYAASADWTLIHLGQFVGMSVFLAGLVLLASAFDTDKNPPGPRLLMRLGSAAALVTLALYAILQAVDGVAVKQAVDAWAHATEAEKPALLASAETLRWLEWGIRSYQSFMLGITLVTCGTGSLGDEDTAGHGYPNGAIGSGVHAARLSDRAGRLFEPQHRPTARRLSTDVRLEHLAANLRSPQERASHRSVTSLDS
jgi:hypothetical protein